MSIANIHAPFITEELTCRTIKIYQDPVSDYDGINKKYFNNNIPLETGNINYIDNNLSIGQHYKAVDVNGKECIKSDLIENSTEFNFNNKDLKNIDDIEAVKIIKVNGLSTELLKANGDTYNINNIGNMKYSPLTGYTGNHIIQNDNSGLIYEMSSLSENKSEFDFNNKDLNNINNISNNKIICNIIENNSDLDINANYLNITSPNIYTNGNIECNTIKKTGGLSNQYLMADGSISTQGQGGGGQSNIYLYNFSSSLTPPPNSGQIIFNNNVYNNVSNVYISHITSDTIDIDAFLNLISPNNILYIQDRDTSLKYVQFNVINSSIIPNNYINITVSYIASEGTFFLNNHNIFFSIFINTTSFNNRLDALEIKTRYQSSNTSLQTTFNNNLNGDTITANTYIKNGSTSNDFLKGDGTTTKLNNGSGISFSSVGDTLNIINNKPSTDININNSGTGESIINPISTNPNYYLKSFKYLNGIQIIPYNDSLEISNTQPASLINISSVGGQNSLISSNTNPNFNIKSIGSNNLNFTSNANELYINNPSPSTLINLSNSGTGSSLINNSSSNPNFILKSLVGGTGVSLNNNTDNITINNILPSTLINISSVGSQNSIISSSTNPNFNLKSIGSTNLNFTSNANELYINNPSPSTLININSASVSGESLISSNTNPTFNLKTLVAGTNISLSSTSSEITINSTGGSSSSTGYPFNPIQNATTTLGSGSKAYFYTILISRATIISGVQFYLSSGADPMRVGIYRGYLKSGVSGIITLVGQTTNTSVVAGLPYIRKTITAETGQNLNFGIGEYMTIAFHSSGTTSVYMQSATLSVGNSDLMYNSSSNYVASPGFPSTLNQTTILGTVVSKICFELY